jgi:predicted enzyme related to lactoylglutathione lyase
MTERFSSGQFCWVDLQTADMEQAKTFYARLLGWVARDVQSDQRPVYTVFELDGVPVAGMGPMPLDRQQAGASAGWQSYIAVDAVDEAVKRAEANGATVLTPTTKVTDHGSLAFLKDPVGAAFGLWQSNSPVGAARDDATGRCCWHEVYSSDMAASQQFYQQVLGWELRQNEMPGGPYCTFRAADRDVAGMMAIQPEWGEMPPSWMAYFSVDSCAHTTEVARSLGADVFVTPTEIPSVGTFAGIRDPRGASFMLLQLAGRSDAG